MPSILKADGQGQFVFRTSSDAFEIELRELFQLQICCQGSSTLLGKTHPRNPGRMMHQMKVHEYHENPWDMVTLHARIQVEKVF